MQSRRIFTPGMRAASAIEGFRLLLRQFLDSLQWPMQNAAIAVPTIEAGRFLRDVLDWRGHILDLSCLQYPGFSYFPAGYLAYFAECGREGHVGVPGSEDYWTPTWVQRPDTRETFLKCTMRSVQMMRHWTEYFYPPIVMQQGYWQEHWPRNKYNIKRHAIDLGSDYMDFRTAELSQLNEPYYQEYPWEEIYNVIDGRADKSAWHFPNFDEDHGDFAE